jgi:hypothetical protein
LIDCGSILILFTQFCFKCSEPIFNDLIAAPGMVWGIFKISLIDVLNVIPSDSIGKVSGPESLRASIKGILLNGMLAIMLFIVEM